MSATPRPHDLVWLNHASALEDIAEPWVAQQWRAALPVVVRRDVDDQARVPVGVRGDGSASSAPPAWVQARNIVRSVTPEMLVDREVLLHSPFVSQPPVQGAIALTLHRWPWGWGRHRQYRLRAGNRDPGAACGQRSGSADPRATTAGPRGAAGMADPGGQLPCRADTQVENAVRRLRP